MEAKRYSEMSEDNEKQEYCCYNSVCANRVAQEESTFMVGLVSSEQEDHYSSTSRLNRVYRRTVAVKPGDD